MEYPPRLLGDGVKSPDITNVYTTASPTAASGPELLLENQGYRFYFRCSSEWGWWATLSDANSTICVPAPSSKNPIGPSERFSDSTLFHCRTVWE